MGGSVQISLILIVLTLLLASAPTVTVKAAESGSAILPGNPLEGSQLFTDKGCLRCHSINGVGGAGGPDLGQGILNRCSISPA
jgi:mono/diheme cytochrome c family protein